ncbi:MAG: potassium channel protein [Chloroflexota bacterium]
MGKLLARPFLAVISLAGGMVILGTLGYMLIEGWSFIDALFMTMITMTTIGYGEVHQLSPLGRVYTIGLIVIGVVTASYTITAVVEVLTSQDFLKQLRDHRRRRELEKISNHCIICGFGRLGRTLARELKDRRFPIIVVDLDDAAIEACQQLDIQAVQGNAADERILHQAGISRAKALVAAANSDAENVFIVLSAKGINPNLQIITRCNSEGSIPKLEKAGADSVISPYVTAGRRIAQMVAHPNVLSFLDGILEFGDQQMRLEEFIIDHKSPLAGLTLREAKLKAAVLAVTHPEQALLSHPNADTKLLPGAAIIVMGIDQELKRLAQLVKG